MNRRTFAVLAVIGICMAGRVLEGRAQQPSAAVTIKFATVAPEGTIWMKHMQRAAREIQEATSGAVRVKLYPGGVQGDEIDVIRRMRLGQLQAAGIVGAGLSQVVPSAHLLDLPFLFRSGEEVDHVMQHVLPDYRQKFEAQGFQLLGFTEAGFAHLYSRLPLTSPEDLRRTEVVAWRWAGDSMHEATYEAFGLRSVPLAVLDVLPALQSRRVNTVYAPPAVAVALNWHTAINYVSPRPLGWTVGGMLLTNDAWKQMSAEQQQIVSEVTSRLSRNLVQLVRQENAVALAAIQKLGIKPAPEPSADEWAAFERIGEELKRSLVGTHYSEAELARVELLLAEYRSRKAATGP